MKSSGIVRNIEPLGRIVIPRETRKALNIKEGDMLEIFTNGSSIILKKYNPNCVLCNSEKDIVEFEGRQLCKKCISKLSNIK